MSMVSRLAYSMNCFRNHGSSNVFVYSMIYYSKMDSPEIKKSRVLECELRSDLSQEGIVNEIKSAWKNSSIDFVKNGVEILQNPFPVCTVRNFVKDPELLKLATAELNRVHFNEKNNDLYRFKQSDDVRNLTNFTFIPQLYDLVGVKGRTWVSKIVERSTLHTSATFSCYEYQDRLLCHDDKCEDRHIAFILYLMEDWCENDGGCLEIFNTDSKGYPSTIVRSIVPEFNMLVFFEVTHNSFHQVSEVFSKSKKRLSLNGWFHSSGKKPTEPNYVILENPKTVANHQKFNLKEFFSSTYFNCTNKLDIKKIFSSQSEIQLDNFIAPKFLQEIQTDLKSGAVTWLKKGPPNIRKYEIADESSLTASLKKLKQILESQCWFRYLMDITDLDFASSQRSEKNWEMGSPPVCCIEIQRWTHKCYTLIHDKDPEYHSEALDVILRIPFHQTEKSCETEPGDNEEDSPESGHIIYIDSTSKDEECLLHIGYKMNSLGLIFRDKQTLRFTKYLDSTAEPFYLILCTYRQWKSNAEDGNSEESSSDSLSSDEC